MEKKYRFTRSTSATLHNENPDKKMSKTKAYMPKVTLQAFTSSSGVTKSFDDLKSSVAFEQVNFEQNKGGLLEAIDHFVSNPAPELLVIEESTGQNTLQLLGELASVLDGETELILIGDNDNILTYKSLKSLGVFEYLLNDVSTNELLLVLQEAAVKVRSGKVGTVTTFVPVCSPRVFEEVFYNILKLVRFEESRNFVILDLNIGYGNSDLILHVEENNALSELLEKRTIDKLDLQQACRTVTPGLDILSHNNDFSIYVDDYLGRIAQISNLLRELYDDVFILLPNGWQKIHSHSILRSDQIVLISEDYLNSYRDIVRLSLFFNSSGINFQQIILVINGRKNDPRGKAVIKEISANLGGLTPRVVHALPRIREEIETHNEFNFNAKFSKDQFIALSQIVEGLGLKISHAPNNSKLTNFIKNFSRN